MELTTTFAAIIAALAAILSPLLQEYLRNKHELRLRQMDMVQEKLLQTIRDLSEAFADMSFSSLPAKPYKDFIAASYTLVALVEDQQIQSNLLGFIHLVEGSNGIVNQNINVEFSSTMTDLSRYASLSLKNLTSRHKHCG